MRIPRDPIWQLRIRPVRILLSLGILALLVWLSLPAILTACARALIRTDPPARGDLAVVLGGGEGERLGAAVRIYKQGRAGGLLITDPGVPLLPVYSGEDSLTMGEVKRRLAIRRGVPPDRVWLLEGGTSTYEEAVGSLRFLRDHGAAEAIIVTSPFHSRRARATFRSVFAGSGIAIHLETLPLAESEEQVARWWMREEETMAVYTETVKLFYYWCRHRVRPGW